MCGRYGLTIEEEEIGVAYGVEPSDLGHEPRYNIAPSQVVPVLLSDRTGRRVAGFRWGLVPPSATDPNVSYRTINARSETVSRRPAFRGAWRKRQRCVVLADGFYEWRASGRGSGAKVPYWIRMADARPFGFAGLWERWKGPEGERLTCTVLTTDANELLRPIHDRMPVILAEDAEWSAWIDAHTASDELRSLLAPQAPEDMHLYPVGSYVNHHANEGPSCIEPAPVVSEPGEGDGPPRMKDEQVTLDLGS